MAPPRLLLVLPALLLAALAFLGPASANAVIGIDYGTEWFKVALVKPGIPLDMVLNRESKRKTYSLVTIKQDERLFGADAAAVAARFPLHTYPNLKPLLGQPFNSPAVSAYKNVFGHDMIPHPRRNTVQFTAANGDIVPVEELIAMQLAHARQMAEGKAGRPIDGAIITIPPYLAQFERRAMLEAAELAGLKTLTLLHDETAVAINYAMMRQFPKLQRHIFYDMGAGSTTASLISFVGGTKNTKTITIKVEHVAYDTALGGRDVDAFVVDMLVAQFNEKYGKRASTPLSENPRAMAKLYKEAARVKQILSVNTQVAASVEGLHEDIDFRGLVKRADLEAKLEPLAARIMAPIESVIEYARASANGSQPFESLVLVGGGVRVPFVQRMLEQAVGEDKIAKNVNGDEAAVMGAALRAAAMSRGFRVRDMQITDTLPFDVKLNSTTLFAAHKAALSSAKSVTLRKSEDIFFQVNEGETHVGTFATKEVDSKYLEEKITFRLTENGIVAIANASATVSVGGSSGILGIGATPAENATKPLEFTWTETIPGMTSEELKQGSDRLAAWTERERAKAARDAARNSLEALVYKARDPAGHEPRLTKVATETELSEVSNMAKEKGDWLDDHFNDGTEGQFADAYQTLHHALDTLLHRLRRMDDLLVQVRTDAAELNQTETWTKWAREFEDREACDLAELERTAKDLTAKVEKQRKELEEKLRREREERERLRKEKAEREAKEKAEREAKEKAEREAKEKAEREAKEAAANNTDTSAAPNSTEPEPSSSPTATLVTPAPSSKPTPTENEHTEL